MVSGQALYRQCRLYRETSRGMQYRYTWLPDCYCKAGRVLSLNGEDGWTVDFVSDGAASKPPYAPRDIRLHRAATGDSLPK